MNSDNSKKIVTLALAGLAVGATAWFLLKNPKGKELSSTLIGSIKDRVNDKIDRFSGHAGAVVSGLKTKARDSMPA